MDNCCREYLFVVDFFGHTPNTAQSFFDEILGKTLAYLLVSELNVFLITEVYLSSHSLLPLLLPLPPLPYPSYCTHSNILHTMWIVATMPLVSSCAFTSTIATKPS